METRTAGAAGGPGKPTGSNPGRAPRSDPTAVTTEQLAEISRRIALRVVAIFGLDCSSVALDMTNFAAFINTGNGKAPIAQRGKAKQKRSDLRLVGLGLVVTRDGGIPLTWHAYPGDKPDVTQFPAMADQLRGQYEAICAAAAAAPAADMTVVFDAGQNSEANFAHLASTNLHYIGSVPASDCPDLTALPASVRATVDRERFGGLTAYDTRRQTHGAGRRTILTHSPELHAAQACGFEGTTLAKAGKKLDELAATLARGKTRRPREKDGRAPLALDVSHALARAPETTHRTPCELASACSLALAGAVQPADQRRVTAGCRASFLSLDPPCK